MVKLTGLCKRTACLQENNTKGTTDTNASLRIPKSIHSVLAMSFAITPYRVCHTVPGMIPSCLHCTVSDLVRIGPIYDIRRSWKTVCLRSIQDTLFENLRFFDRKNCPASYITICLPGVQSHKQAFLFMYVEYWMKKKIYLC